MNHTSKKHWTLVIACAAAAAICWLAVLWLKRGSRPEQGPPIAEHQQQPTSVPISATEAPQAPRDSVTEDPKAGGLQPAVEIPMTVRGLVVESFTGRTIDLARVTVRPLLDREAAASAVSGVGGEFTTEPVPAGDYLVSVSADGFATRTLRLEVPMCQFANAAGAPEVSVGTVVLMRGFRGVFTVMDLDSQRPIAGAGVYVLEGAERRTLAPILYLGVTDQDGRVESAEKIAAASEDTVALALTADGLGWTALATGDREAASKTFVIPVSKCGDLRIRVTDPNGAPIGQAAVRVRPEFYPLGELGANQPLEHLGDGDRLKRRVLWSGDESGQIALLGLPRSTAARAYTLVISHKGRQSVTLQNRNPSPPNAVGDPEVVVLASESRITAVDGTVRGGDASALRQVSIRCGTQTTTPDPRIGSYHIGALDIPSAEFAIEASATGYFIDKKYPPASSTDHITVDFEMLRESSISGQVVDDAGKPLDRVSVTAALRDGGVDHSFISVPRLTLSDGRFAFPSVPVGEYTLSVGGPEPSSDYRHTDDLVVRAGDHQVRIVRAKDLGPKGTVHADVIDAHTGAPLDVLAAKILPNNQAASQLNVPDPDSISIGIGAVDVRALGVGKWRLWVLVEPGRVAFAELETTVQVPNAAVVLKVAGGYYIAGQLEYEDPLSKEKPRWERFRIDAKSAENWVCPETPLWRPLVKTSGLVFAAADGTFLIPGLLPGTYRVIAKGDGLSGDATVVVSDGDPEVARVIVHTAKETATIVVSGDPDFFDGRTMVRFTDNGAAWPDWALKGDYPGAAESTFAVHPGPARIQLWRVPGGGSTPNAVTYIIDESTNITPGERHLVKLTRDK